MKSGKALPAVMDRSVLRPLRLSGASGPDVRYGSDSAAAGSAVTASVCGTAGGRFDLTIPMMISSVMNGLACGKAVCAGLRSDIVFPADMDEAELKRIMTETAQLCAASGIIAAGGHTCVSHAVSLPVITFTGIGSAAEPAADRSGKSGRAETVREGTPIIMAGETGLGGTAVLLRAFRDRLAGRFPQTMLADAEEFENRVLVTEAAFTAWAGGALAVHDVSSGGILAALWEMSEYLQTGFEAGLRSILLRQETVEICEYLGLNPYQLYGQGSLLIAAESDAAAEKIISDLAKASVPAAVIGRTVKGAGRVLVNGEDRQYLEKPQQDMLAKLADAEFERR